MSQLSRSLHKKLADWGGYFWLPCPRCGREFGGHEEGGGTDWVTPTSGRSCCPNCPGDRLLYDASAVPADGEVRR